MHRHRPSKSGNAELLNSRLKGVMYQRIEGCVHARQPRRVITSNGFSNGTRNYVKGLQTGRKIKNHINLEHVDRRTGH